MTTDITRVTRELSIVWDAVCSATDSILASVDDIDAVNDATCLARPEATLSALNKIRAACAFRENTADRIALVIGLLSHHSTTDLDDCLVEFRDFESADFEPTKLDLNISINALPGSCR